MDLVKEINGCTLEYFDREHLYLVDGEIVPSITTLLKTDKYQNVSKQVLRRAAAKGTELHDAIERLCRYGEESNLKEVRNFKFLQRKYGFQVLENEVPVILWHKEKPAAAGRLDLVLEMDGEIGGADIKRTSVLDKNYLAYQLNLYRIAYRQSYGIEWKFLKGIHLREDVRRFVDIPINEEIAWELIREKLGN